MPWIKKLHTTSKHCNNNANKLLYIGY